MEICKIQNVKNICIHDLTKSSFMVDITFIVKIDDELSEDDFDCLTGIYSFNQEEEKAQVELINYQDEFEHYWDNQISMDSIFEELAEFLTQFIKKNKDFIS